MISQRVFWLLIIVAVAMERDFVSTHVTKINGKTFLVPDYNLEGYERFLLPRLDFKGQQHVYFNSDDIR